MNQLVAITNQSDLKMYSFIVRNGQKDIREYLVTAHNHLLIKHIKIKLKRLV